MTLEGLNFLVKKFRINEEQCSFINVEQTMSYTGDSYTLDVGYLDGTQKTYRFYYRSFRNAGLSSDDVLMTDEPHDYIELVQYLLDEADYKEEYNRNIKRNENGDVVLKLR